MKNLVTLLLIGILFITCENSDNNNLELSAIAESRMDLNSSIQTKKGFSANETNQNSKEPISRKLIKNGNVVFETDNLEKTKNHIENLVQKFDGYISSDSKNEYDNKVNYYLNIRIPAEHFDSILTGISKQISKFDSKEITISDVTEEFLDIESRLKNKKELEKRYLEILQQAKSVEDILNVERELGKLREEIEATEGRLNYLSNQVAFSTLAVSFYKKANSESSFFGKIGESFKNGFENLKSFFLAILAIWPFIILISIGFILIKKWRNRNIKK
jgi:primosomal protein N''